MTKPGSTSSGRTVVHWPPRMLKGPLLDVRAPPRRSGLWGASEFGKNTAKMMTSECRVASTSQGSIQSFCYHVEATIFLEDLKVPYRGGTLCYSQIFINYLSLSLSLSPSPCEGEPRSSAMADMVWKMAPFHVLSMWICVRMYTYTHKRHMQNMNINTNISHKHKHNIHTGLSSSPI